MAATNGGALVIGDNNTSQGPTGLILADGGTVYMTGGSRIAGGRLDTANGGAFIGGASHSLHGLTNDGALNLIGGARVYWEASASTNNGTVTIDADQSASDAILYAHNGFWISTAPASSCCGQRATSTTRRSRPTTAA